MTFFFSEVLNDESIRDGILTEQSNEANGKSCVIYYGLIRRSTIKYLRRMKNRPKIVGTSMKYRQKEKQINCESFVMILFWRCSYSARWPILFVLNKFCCRFFCCCDDKQQMFAIYSSNRFLRRTINAESNPKSCRLRRLHSIEWKSAYLKRSILTNPNHRLILESQNYVR